MCSVFFVKERGPTEIDPGPLVGGLVLVQGPARGAFTARSLGGMLTRCGVPAKSRLNGACASHAFDVYRRNSAAVTAQFRTDYQLSLIHI